MRACEIPNNKDERILILAPFGMDAVLTARFLRKEDFQVEICDTIERLCQEMLDGAGPIFITSEVLTHDAVQRLIEALRQQPAWSDIPLIILVSGGEAPPVNAELLTMLSEVGNVTFIERPVRVMTLMSTLRAALRARYRQYDVRDYIEKQKLAVAEREALLLSEQQARAEAERASRLKDEFLATVSHELRTPLNAMLGWTHLLRNGRLDTQAAAHALDTIERNVRLQSQLIEDLLDISRIITGKLRLDIRLVDPTSFIDAAIEAVLPAADAKGINIQKEIDSKISSVSGDQARLQQVVWNLLSNAIKFTQRGGRVHVRLERINSHIEISVSDNGEGIKPEFLPFVFDRFRQADGTTTRRYSGLGLGLAIVRHIVELHGGTIHVKSDREGKGATFTVRLPLAPNYRLGAGAEEEPVHPIAATNNHHPIEYADKLNGLKVLVVDDEVDTLELIKISLGQCGAEVTMARSSAEALKQLEQITPDVIISDIGMPEEDGFEFIRKVRGLPAERGGRVPAVALTAYARGKDRLQVLRSGYQMYVPKPVELAELAAIVANVAGRM